MRFHKKDWEYLGQWVQPIISASFWDNWSHNNYPFKIDKLKGKYLMLDGHSFALKGDIEAIEKTIRNKPRIKKQLYNWLKNTEKKCRTITPNNSLNKFRNLYSELTNGWVFCLLLDKVISDKIKEICNKEGLFFDEVIKNSRPIKKSYIEMQNQDAKKIYHKIVRKKIDIDKGIFRYNAQIMNHVKRYRSCGVHHFIGQPYSIEIFKNNFQQIKQKKKLKNNIPRSLRYFIKLASIASYGRIRMAETSGFMQLKFRKNRCIPSQWKRNCNR